MSTHDRIANMNEYDDNLQPLCSHCKIQLLEPYIECVECDDVCLCTGCFARGAEVLKHKNDHDYSVRRNDCPIFEDTDWSAKDEYLLLQAIAQFGYGNWIDISKVMQKYGEYQCREHYNRFYVDKPQCEDLPKLESWSFITHDPPYLLRESKNEDLPRRIDSDQLLAGYNAYRGEFRVNYDNHVDKLLQFEEIEDDEDRNLIESLQCAAVTAYNNRLRERRRRYEIIRRYGLIVVRKVNAWMAHYEQYLGKNVCNGLSRLMQLLPGTEFDVFLESLSRERELRMQLNKLYEYREKGLTTFKGCELYERLKKQRDKHQKELRNSCYGELDWQQLTNNKASHVRMTLQSRDNKRRTTAPLEIMGLPDYEKLSKKEREFCSNVRLTPSSFIRFKEILISESEKNGFLRLCDARKLIKIDVNKTRKLYDMLIQEGLVTKETSNGN